MEWRDPPVPRSFIHLLEKTGAGNSRAERLLGYRPLHHWKQAVDARLEEMGKRQGRPMPMHVPMG